MLLLSLVSIGLSVWYLANAPILIREKYDKEEIRNLQGIGISFNDDKTRVQTVLTFIPKIAQIILVTY